MRFSWTHSFFIFNKRKEILFRHPISFELPFFYNSIGHEMLLLKAKRILLFHSDHNKHKRRACMHCLGIPWTRLFDMDLTSAEGQMLIFEWKAKHILQVIWKYSKRIT